MSASPGAPAPLIGATDYLRQALQLLDGRPALANDDAGVTVTWVDIAGVRASVAAALTLLERQPAVSRGVPTPAMIDTLIAHRWSATQVWPNDDAKVYCRCGTLVLGTTEAEAHAAWAAHVFEVLRAALTAQEES